MTVRKATKSDLRVILGWLQHRETGVGFWCNERVITKSLAEGELWVIRREKEAVAFQVGDYAADIACVRRDCQRQGLGTELFEASLARAVRDDINVLSGECAPISSLPFWEAKGFERYEGGHSVFVRRILQRTLEIPAASSIASVVVTFYPEEVGYKTEVEPAAVHHVPDYSSGSWRARHLLRCIRILDGSPGADPQVRHDGEVADGLSDPVTLPCHRQPPGRADDTDCIRVRLYTCKPQPDICAAARPAPAARPHHG